MRKFTIFFLVLACIALMSATAAAQQTATPAVDFPVIEGATSVSGTSTEADGTTIQVYVNGSAAGITTTTVTGGAWTKSGLTALVAGDLVKAKATASGKTESEFSNEVTVQGVTSAPVVNTPIIEGATSVSGTSTEADGTTIQVYVNGSAAGITTTTVTGGAWTKSGLTALVAGDLVKAKATASGKTESDFSNEVTVQGVTSAPVVNTPIGEGATSVSGTSTEADGTTIQVYVNGSTAGITTTTVTGGAWTKSGLTALVAGDLVKAKATASGKTESDFSNEVTVQAAVTVAPVVDSPIIEGATSVSGTSTEADGTTIQVYVNGSAAGITTTTVTGGAWTKSGLTALVAGDLVKAKATASGKTESDFSNEVTVQGVTSAPVVNTPIGEGATSVSGTSTEADGTTIQVYVNGSTAGITTTTVTGGAWTKSGLTALVAGDLVKAKATASGKTESEFSNEVTVQALILANFLVETEGGGPIPQQRPNTPFSIKITARDAGGNTVPSFSGTVDITSTGTLTSGGGSTLAFTEGVLASHSVTISNAGSFTITATKATTLETGTSSTFAVLPTIFVSTTGDDGTGDGTVTRPFRTIQKGVTTSSATDTIFVSSGTYSESVTVTKAVYIFGTGNPSVTDFTFKVSPIVVRGIDVPTISINTPAIIQDGVDAIPVFGTINVGAGTYTEHVVINKSMNIIGSGTSNPTIDGGGTGNCVTLAAPYVRMKNLILTNAQNGIAGTTTNAQLRFLTIHGNSGSGISLSNSDYNLFHSNLLYGHTNPTSAGIELIGSRGNTITSNDIHDNTYNVRISAMVYRASYGNLVLGNTLSDPGTWSVQVSSGAAKTKVNQNVFSTATTSNKFVSNTSAAPETLDARSNWFGGQDPPGGVAHPGTFEGRVDSSNWLDNSTNTYVMVAPYEHMMNIGEAIYVPVLAYVPPGKEVRITQATLTWNSTVAGMVDGEIPGVFFANKLTTGQTESFSFTPSSPTNTITVYDTLKGGTNGAGPSGSIPYVGTLFIMRFRGSASGFDTLKLSGVAVKDQNLADITPLVTLTPGVIAVDPPGASGLIADLKVYLQGPFSGGSMDTTLRHNNLIPYTQPYNVSPWNYAGTEAVGSIPDGVVDWVLVELRTDTAANTTFATRAGWLMRNGLIEELLGGRPLIFPVFDSGNYYVVVRHRNHLAVMSAAPVAINLNSARYDFTTDLGKYYGGDAKEVATGVYGLWSGDVTANGQLKYIGSGNDRSPILTRVGGTDLTATTNGYYREDVNMNGQVKYSGSGNDRSFILSNLGGTDLTATKMTKVPN